MEVQKLFKANKRESAVDIVVNNIKHLLMERKLKPGDRLPSESEISEGMVCQPWFRPGSHEDSVRIWTL